MEGLVAGPTVESCAHRTQHAHGTYSAYTKCGCRCDECRSAKREYARNSRLRTAVAKWSETPEPNRWTDNSAAVGTIIRLLASGAVSRRAVSLAAGANKEMVRRIESGLVRQSPASVARLSQVTFADVGTTVGVIRRIQILMSAGWPLNQIATRAGVTRWALQMILRGDRRATTSTMRQKIGKVFQELHHLDPIRAGVAAPRVAATRARAARLHYPTAWAFDELTLIRDGHPIAILDVDDPASSAQGMASDDPADTPVSSWKQMDPHERVGWFASAALRGIGFTEAVKLSGAPSESAALRAVQRAGVSGMRGWFKDPVTASAFLSARTRQ